MENEERASKKTLYKMKFHRYNSHVSPVITQETDVLFQTALSEDDDDFESEAWEEMWKQNPAWLLSHGPSLIGFHGWSSVMTVSDSLEKVEYIPPDEITDGTGPGNMAVPLTFHPWLPDDLRVLLKSAYNRGLNDQSS